MHIALRTLVTLAISAVGAFAMDLTRMAGAMLMGGAIAVGCAVALGFKAKLHNRVRNALFIGIGLQMGASASPDTLQLLGQWPITLSALAIELVVIVGLCALYLHKVAKLDLGTAYLGSFPGHLTLILALATSGTGDPRKIMVIQTTRVALLTLCAPIGGLFLQMGTFSTASEGPMAITTLAFAVAACAFVGWVFAKFRVAAGYVLGSMLVAMTLKLTGNFHGQLPQPLVAITFIGMGALIGAAFSGVSRAEITSALTSGIVASAISIAVVTVTSLITAQFVDMPFGQLWLGLAPGGIESMGALGVALGYDTAFIAGHHVVRMLLLILAIPLVAMMFRGSAEPEPR